MILPIGKVRAINHPGNSDTVYGTEHAWGEKRPLSPSIQIPLRIQPLKGRKFAKSIEESFLILVTTSLAVGHDLVLCLVGPLQHI